MDASMGYPFLTEETDADIVARFWQGLRAGLARNVYKCWNHTMLNTTFGYVDAQDRVWLSLGESTPRVWLTRRITLHLLGGMARQLELSTPGAVAGADAATRARIEHQLALHEDADPDGGAPGEVPIRLGQEAREVTRGAEYLLCTGLQATFRPDGQCAVTLNLEDGSGRVLQFSRAGLHRWLRGLWVMARHAGWLDAAEVPAWLCESMLPPALQAVVRAPGGAARDNGGVGGTAPLP
jgi:hypothetical protein